MAYDEYGRDLRSEQARTARTGNLHGAISNGRTWIADRMLGIAPSGSVTHPGPAPTPYPEHELPKHRKALVQYLRSVPSELPVQFHQKWAYFADCLDAGQAATSLDAAWEMAAEYSDARASYESRFSALTLPPYLSATTEGIGKEIGAVMWLLEQILAANAHSGRSNT
jgi:hypothetical protein